MISIAYGDEPYGIEVKKKKIKDMITLPAMNYSYFTDEFSYEVVDICRTVPFMEEKRGVILEIDSLNALDLRIFYEYCECPIDSTELLIVAKNVDKRTAIYKSLDKKGLLAPCMKLNEIDDLKKVIAYELKKRNANIKLDAVDHFIKKMNYFDNEDINLLNVVGYLDSCVCVSTVITKEIVDQVCPSFEEADIFKLASLINENRSNELYRQIIMIPARESIGILSLLLRDFRVAYKLKYFDPASISAKKTAFAPYPRELLCECMNIITSVIADIKIGRCAEDQALLIACGRILSIVNTRKM